MKAGIHVGVGGWIFHEWRDNFYPRGLPHKQELAYASGKLTSIEINGTFYRTPKPADFVRWRDGTPDDFVFALKAPRFATNRRDLAGAGESIARFLASGVLELGDKLGPINWQLPPTKRFVAEEFAAFLRLLPPVLDGRPLRHAVELRHDSFRDSDATEIARDHGIAIVLAGDSAYPRIEAVTAPFVYARLMGTSDTEATGYAAAELDAWAGRLRGWQRDGLEVFCYVISGHKPRNPAAALALIERTAR